MNQLFNKPLDAAFYTGITIIILQFLSKRIKPATKEKINTGIKNLNIQLKAIKFGKLVDNFSKHSLFMLIIFLNGLLIVYFGYKIFQHQMLIDGKEVPSLHIDNLIFIGCLMILLFILGKVRTSSGIKERKNTAFKAAGISASLLIALTLLVIVISIFDIFSRFQEGRGIIWIILQGIAAFFGIMFFSLITLSILLHIIIIPALFVLRKIYLFLFPAEGDALDIALITIVAILGIIKTVAGYL